MAYISHKLKNSLEGALAGGADAATSPLYVFGPFLSLIIVSGAARVIFGGSVWLAVLTIAVVSAMYRLVMQWVTDGPGGNGLSEEEFGRWAVKVNAPITFIEYTFDLPGQYGRYGHLYRRSLPDSQQPHPGAPIPYPGRDWAQSLDWLVVQPGPQDGFPHLWSIHRRRTDPLVADDFGDTDPDWLSSAGAVLRCLCTPQPVLHARRICPHPGGDDRH